MNKTIINCILATACGYVSAQELRIDMHSELQTNGKKAKWNALLHTDFTISNDAGIGGELKTISVASTTDKRMMNDLQVFSNMDSDPIPLTLAVFCASWETERTNLAVGVRNVNERYFITDLTSLFTNSSCGIFPTLSANYDIANFPVASIGLDFSLNMNSFSLDASVYNGRGYSKIWGKESVFSFNPKRDGVFGILSLNHEAGYGNSHIGFATLDRKYTLWTYCEINLTEKSCLHLQYSHAFGDVDCRQYAGFGFATMARAVRIGMLGNLARFEECNEWATEVTAAIPVSENVVLQPAFHAVDTNGEWQFAGLLRLSFGFEKTEWRKQKEPASELEPCNNKRRKNK